MLELTCGVVGWMMLCLGVVFAPWVELGRLRRENAVLRDKERALRARVCELVDGPGSG